MIVDAFSRDSTSVRPPRVHPGNSTCLGPACRECEEDAHRRGECGGYYKCAICAGIIGRQKTIEMEAYRDALGDEHLRRRRREPTMTDADARRQRAKRRAKAKAARRARRAQR